METTAFEGVQSVPGAGPAGGYDDLGALAETVSASEPSDQQLKQGRRSKEARQKPAKTVGITFGDDFLLDSRAVADVKNAKHVIRSLALSHFPDTDRYKSNDFYFAYVHRDGILTSCIIKSRSYEVGKLPGFAPAMLHPGLYILRRGVQTFVIENEEGKLTNVLHPEPQQDGIDLEALAEQGELQDVPKTLHLQWSLDHHHKPLTMIMAAVFIVLLAGYGLTMQRYQDLSKQAMKVNEVAPLPPAATRLPPLAMVLKDVAATTAPQGAVIKMVKTVEINKFGIALGFKNENDARDFITHRGGNYEDGKVVFPINLTAGGQPDSRK